MRDYLNIKGISRNNLFESFGKMYKNSQRHNKNVAQKDFKKSEYILLTNAENAFDFVHILGMLYNWMTVFDTIEKENDTRNIKNVLNIKRDQVNFPINLPYYTYSIWVNKNFLFDHVISFSDTNKYLSEKNVVLKKNMKTQIKNYAAISKDLYLVLSFLEENFNITNLHRNLCVNFYDDSIAGHRLTFYHNDKLYNYSYSDFIDKNKTNSNLPKAIKGPNYNYINDIQIKTLYGNKYNMYLKYYEVKKQYPRSHNVSEGKREKRKNKIKNKITDIFQNISKKCFDYQRVLFGMNDKFMQNILDRAEKNILSYVKDFVDEDIRKEFLHNPEYKTNISNFNIKNNPFNNIRDYTDDNNTKKQIYKLEKQFSNKV